MTEHESIIETLTTNDKTVQTKGFKKQLRKAIKPFTLDKDELTSILNFNRKPDAFKIDIKQQELTLYEVEVSHPIPSVKINDYTWLWFDLLGIEWDFILVPVSRRGALDYTFRFSLAEIMEDGVPEMIPLVD